MMLVSAECLELELRVGGEQTVGVWGALNQEDRRALYAVWQRCGRRRAPLITAPPRPSWRPAGWSPGIAPQVGSAVWPVGLLLSVEVLSRVPWAPGFWWALARYGGAGTVAVGSAIISYAHVHEVLIAWSYGPLGAAVGPLVLDGLMVVSGFALLTMSRMQAGTAGSVMADLAAEAGGADE